MTSGSRVRLSAVPSFALLSLTRESRLVGTASFQEVLKMKSMLFTDLPLAGELQTALREADHHTPTPIQAAAIPVVLSGRDLLGCAQTGTGKTAAFALPMLQQFHARSSRPVSTAPLALVLVPTRELAAQVVESFRCYGKYLRVSHTAVYGGVGQQPQVAALRRGVHVLVATPGRLLDLLQQGHVRLDQVRTLVLDEADRMLDMGFLPPLKKIIARLPAERQSLCFSATMPREIAELVQSLLRSPERIDVAPPSSTSRQVQQRLLEVPHSAKREHLQRLLGDGEMERVLVFTRTKRRADVVAKQLRQADIAADVIHGDKSQTARTRALERFKRGQIHVLVATDVAARGLDVEGISHVVNYDLPHDPESYVHRIGRTGRAGAVGLAITFYDPSERGQVRLIEKLTGQSLLPAGADRRPLGGPAGDRAARRGEERRPQNGRPARRRRSSPPHTERSGSPRLERGPMELVQSASEGGGAGSRRPLPRRHRRSGRAGRS